MSEITVTKVNTYPIKSCSPLETDSAEVGKLGLKNDRLFMLIGNLGQMITQRTHPQLALVKTALGSIDKDTIEVTAPDFESITIETEEDEDAPEITVDLFKKTGTGIEVPAASAYFTEYLGKNVRLVQIKEPRAIKPECQVEGAVTQTGFADGFPILLASESSLEELNRQLDEPILIDRFRANVVVEGTQAYDEDYWKEVRIGHLRAYVVRACARCPIPNVDQSLGQLPKKRPVTSALRKYRSGVDPVNDSKGEFFGQNLTHIFMPGQRISVGDTVEIIDRSIERNFLLDT